MSKPPARTPSLTDFRRIVVKVGSSLLVDSAAGSLKRDWLASLAADIAALQKTSLQPGPPQPRKVGWRGCTLSLKSSNAFQAGSGGSRPDCGV
jgi:hypothetical protein